MPRSDRKSADRSRPSAQHFRYSKAEWNAIRREVPGGAAPRGLRASLETEADFFLRVRGSENDRSATKAYAVYSRRIGPLVAKIDRLLLEVAPINNRFFLDDATDHALLKSLGGLRELLEARVPKARRSNRHDPRREAFFRASMFRWREAGGKLEASTNELTGLPRGPLIRFLRAVAEPVFNRASKKTPTDHALRSIVRKLVKRL